MLERTAVAFTLCNSVVVNHDSLLGLFDLGYGKATLWTDSLTRVETRTYKIICKLRSGIPIE